MSRRMVPRVAAAALGSVLCSFSSDASRVAEAKGTSKKEPKSAAPKTLAELSLSLTHRGRHVFLTGHIDDDAAKAVIATLMYLEQESPGVPIQLHINSGGGKVHAGLAIRDVMEALSSPVHTICHGHCSSMAAVLLAFGAVGQRAAGPNARIMIHQPTRSAGSSSNARQMQIHAASIEQSRVRLAELLSLRTGRSVKEMETLMEYDHYCDPAQAIELGLIDRILEARDVGATLGGTATPPAPPSMASSSAADTTEAVAD